MQVTPFLQAVSLVDNGLLSEAVASQNQCSFMLKTQTSFDCYTGKRVVCSNEAAVYPFNTTCSSSRPSVQIQDVKQVKNRSMCLSLFSYES